VQWLNHPRYIPARDRAIATFRNKVQRFKKLSHVLFLCGGAASSRRDAIAKYVRKNRPDTLVFYADDVWLHLAKAASSAENALALEAQLAQLADIVVIVVESPGTFAELGAFSLSAPLRKKLLPVMNAQFQHDESFLNTGPVRWIDTDSFFGPTIHADFLHILSSADELEKRLDRLPKPTRMKIEQIEASPKHLLFLLCDLVTVVGPVSAPQCSHYIDHIVDAPLVGVDVPHLLGLAATLKLVHSGTVGKETYYVPSSVQAFSRRKFMNPSRERLGIVAALQTIPEARPALELLGR
jgi:hypothetical protein